MSIVINYYYLGFYVHLYLDVGVNEVTILSLDFQPASNIEHTQLGLGRKANLTGTPRWLLVTHPGTNHVHVQRCLNLVIGKSNEDPMKSFVS